MLDALKLNVSKDGSSIFLEDLKLRYVENYRVSKSSETGEHAVLELKMLVDLVIPDQIDRGGRDVEWITQLSD